MADPAIDPGAADPVPGAEGAVLLDTHALLWLQYEPDRLSTAQRDVLVQARLRLVSAASLYEIAQKVRRGGLPLDAAAVDELRDGLGAIGLRWLPLTADVMARAGGVEWAHRDPFDRMILAAAEATGCPLISSDARFAADDLPFVVPAVIA